MAYNKIIYGVGGTVIGVAITIALDLPETGAMLTPILASAGASLGCLKDSDGSTRRKMIPFLFGVLAALVLVAAAYFIPSVFSEYGRTKAPSETVQLGEYLQNALTAVFFVRALLSSLVGYTAVWLYGRYLV